MTDQDTERHNRQIFELQKRVAELEGKPVYEPLVDAMELHNWSQKFIPDGPTHHDFFALCLRKAADRIEEEVRSGKDGKRLITEMLREWADAEVKL
jgi:hypothetical protein